MQTQFMVLTITEVMATFTNKITNYHLYTKRHYTITKTIVYISYSSKNLFDPYELALSTFHCQPQKTTSFHLGLPNQ